MVRSFIGIAGLLAAGLLLANGAVLLWRKGSVGYPVASITGSKLVLRFIADSFAPPLKPPPNPFVEFDPSEINGISGHEIEIIWPGPRRTRGHWVLLRLDQKTDAALLEALRPLLQHPPRLWLLGPGQQGEFFVPWYDTFRPPIGEWLGQLSQTWDGVDVQIQKSTLNPSAFAGMREEEQKSAIRKLNALNYRLSAMLLVRSYKNLSIEQADRFIRDAVEHPSTGR
jgi:hypothetical protein